MHLFAPKDKKYDIGSMSTSYGSPQRTPVEYDIGFM